MTRALSILLLLSVFLVGGNLSKAALGPRDPCIHGNRVRFTDADGTRLVGARYGHGTTAVVLAHQSEGNLCQWQPYARRLAAQGFLALPFDFRNYGESQQGSYPAAQLGGDVIAAAKEARSLGARRVFLVGASMGGTAVVVAAANAKPPVNGVVSVSGSSSYGSLDAEAAAKWLAVPALYLAGKGDTVFAYEARTLFAATPGKTKALKLLPGSQHGTGLVGSSSRARALIETFIRSH